MKDKNMCAVYLPHPSDPSSKIVFHCGANGEYGECKYSSNTHGCVYLNDGMDCTNKEAIQDACLGAMAELMLVYEDIEDAKKE